MSRMRYLDKSRDLDGLTNDGNLLDSVLMESTVENYLFLRRVRGGTKAQSGKIMQYESHCDDSWEG